MTLLIEQQRYKQMERQSMQPQNGTTHAQSPACAGMTELFFSERTKDMRAAQTVCSTCPSRQSCLDAARANPPFAGVWGGVIFVNGEELLTKRGRGRPAKNEQLENARVIKALAAQVSDADNDETEKDSDQDLVRQIA